MSIFCVASLGLVYGEDPAPGFHRQGGLRGSGSQGGDGHSEEEAALQGSSKRRGPLGVARGMSSFVGFPEGAP